MKKILLLLIFLILPFVSAQHNYTANDGMVFSTGDNGIVAMNYNGRVVGKMSFGLTGFTIIDGNLGYTSKDFTWTWSKHNYTDIIEEWDEDLGEYVNVSYNVDIFTAYNNKVKFNWTQEWRFHPLEDTKIKHTITNDLGLSILDTKFWYIIVIDRKYGAIFKNASKKIALRDYDFNYNDLINSGFTVTDWYIGKGHKVNLSNKYMAAIAVTKNNGIFPTGKTVVLDPEVTAYKYPSQTGDPLDQWTNGANLKADDNVVATEDVIGERVDTSNYSFFAGMNVTPSGINGILVQVQFAASQGCSIFPTPTRPTVWLGVDLSWDGGNNYTLVKEQSVACNSLKTKSFGAINYTWDRTWTADELSDENFRVRINFTKNSSSDGGTPKADFARVMINYSLLYGNPPIVQLNFPENSSTVNLSYATINISLNDLENNTAELWIWGTNNLSYMNQSLLYHNETAGENMPIDIIYNWTAPIFQPKSGDTNLWAMYHLDDLDEWGESSSVIRDFSWRKLKTETIHNDAVPAPFNGKFGGGWEFRNTDSFAAGFYTANWTNMCHNGCSFTGWGYSDQLGTQYMMGRWQVLPDQNDRFFHLGIQGNLDPRFAITYNGTEATNTLCTVTDITDSFPRYEWHHLTGVLNPSSGTTNTTIKVYVDGILKNSTECQFQDINKTAWNDSEMMYIGNLGSGAAQTLGWDGYIDEVTIWNRSLTDKEIYEMARLNHDTIYYWEANASDSNSSNFNGTWNFNTNLCLYPGTGNWEVSGFNNCVITQNEDLGGNSFILSNPGTFTLNPGINITNWDQRLLYATTLIVNHGARFIS